MSSVTDQHDTSVDRRAVGEPEVQERSLSAVGTRQLLIGCVLAAGIALLLASIAARGSRPPLIEGLPDAGSLTRWALPGSRAIIDLTAVCAVGTLVLAVLLPTSGGELTAQARHLMRAASRWASAWLVGSLLAVPLTISEITARSVPAVLRDGLLREFAFSTGQTQALLFMAWLAGLVAVCAGTIRRRTAAWALLALAVAALLPPAFTGHAAHGDRHVLGVVGLTVHISAMALWCGALLVLLTQSRTLTSVLAPVTARFSRLALVCFVTVAVTGLLTSWSRLAQPSYLWTTDYGRILVAKAVLLSLLGFLGWRHRRRTLPALRAGRPRAFVVLAAVEVVIMAATIGVAVALSRTAPPVREHPGLSAPAISAQLFGEPAVPTPSG
jgi:putative copper export protein